MKECWVTEPLHFEMRETEIPEPKDNEVLLVSAAATSIFIRARTPTPATR